MAAMGLLVGNGGCYRIPRRGEIRNPKITEHVQLINRHVSDKA
jgi:hypothetical protein